MLPSTKLPWSRFGPPVDVRGTIVTMQWDGRALLGRVHGLRRNEVLGMTVLDVRHFNGERWPIEPQYFAVDIVPRTYEEEDEA